MSQTSPSTGRRRRPLAFAAVLAVAAAIAVAIALAVTGGESHTMVELALQRSQLALIGRQLSTLERPFRREVAAAQAVWPELARGLPRHPSARLEQQVLAADAAAQALPAPAFLEARHELIGPAERIAGLFHSFELLVQHGFAHLDQTVRAIRHGHVAAARFERASSGLYVDSVYDGHFDASLIGEHFVNSYERLEEEHASGPTLAPAVLNSILAAFSPQLARLTPHLWRGLLAQR